MRIFFGVFWGSVLVASVGLGKMPSVEKMVFPSVLQCKTSRRNEASVRLDQRGEIKLVQASRQMCWGKSLAMIGRTDKFGWRQRRH